MRAGALIIIICALWSVPWTAQAQYQLCPPNTVLAGPTTGNPAPPACRALILSDIPAIPSKAPNQVDARVYGALCDDATDDSAAFASALSAMSTLGGGIVWIPATGKACLLRTGLTLPAGVSLQGQSGYSQPTNLYDNTAAHWTTSGSWLHCADTTNPCLQITHPGSHIDGLNFWYTQPTPSGSPCAATCTMTHTWTPTTFPYTIKVAPAQSGNYLSNINIINGYRCVDIEGNANEASGVNSYGFYEDHVRLGCFNVVQRMANVDNTISINDWRDQTWWYIGATDLLGYMEGDSGSVGNRIGMDMYFVANAQATNVEFYEDWTGIRATDATVTSGLGSVTVAAQALQFANISFNQTCQGIILASGTTTFTGRFTNVVAAGDPQTSTGSGQCARQWPTFFNLNSDNADVAITNLDGYTMQRIAVVGGGTSGALHLGGNVRGTYSGFASGSNAFTVAAGGALDMPQDYNGLTAGAGAAAPAISGTVNWPTVSASPSSWVNGVAGSARQTTYMTGLSARWGVVTDDVAESGANAGSNFGIYRYGDNGVFVDIPLAITRSTGQAVFADGIKATLPTSCSGQPTGTLYNNSTVVTVCP